MAMPFSEIEALHLREAEAWLAFAKESPDEALRELRAAAGPQDKNAAVRGHPRTAKCSRTCFRTQAPRRSAC